MYHVICSMASLELTIVFEHYLFDGTVFFLVTILGAFVQLLNLVVLMLTAVAVFEDLTLNIQSIVNAL